METTFVSMPDKIVLMKKLKDLDEKAIEFVFKKFDRLESLVKGYELANYAIQRQMDVDTFKEPTEFPKY